MDLQGSRYLLYVASLSKEQCSIRFLPFIVTVEPSGHRAAIQQQSPRKFVHRLFLDYIFVCIGNLKTKFKISI